MTRVLVTGSAGFVGRHVCAALERRPDVSLVGVDRDVEHERLLDAVDAADVVVHLAGVNRPDDPAEFELINVGVTQAICDRLSARGESVLMLLASSTQAGNGTPYGESKLAAERVVERYAVQSRGGHGVVFRFPNLFGKWCRPNYNSVVATFCDAIAQGTEYTVNDPARTVTLEHVDDAVAAFLQAVDEPPPTGRFERRDPGPSRMITLGELARMLEGFRAQRESLLLADFSDPFVRALYSTYLSYLARDDFAYDLLMRTDARGSLAEVLKSKHAGQIFVSRTKPGVTRGNHWHETKVEKFLVVEGEAVIRFRSLLDDSDTEYRVNGEEFRVVDIPPGYAHSIENVGSGELITLFWAVEIFDPSRTDTYPAEVQPAKQ